MEIRLIIAQYKGCPIPQYMPNVIDAWDEFMLESNYEGFEKALAKAKAATGDYEDVRVLIVEVPDRVVTGLFTPPTVQVTVKGDA